VRYVHTNQTIGGRVTITDPRNAATPAPADGGRYPNIVNFVYTETDYDNWLPSASAALEIGDLVARASFSKTMTRPIPTSCCRGLNFSSPSADTGSVGQS
jgi:outer membrane receptor protein involved in Fe transport